MRLQAFSKKFWSKRKSEILMEWVFMYIVWWNKHLRWNVIFKLIVTTILKFFICLPFMKTFLNSKCVKNFVLFYVSHTPFSEVRIDCLCTNLFFISKVLTICPCWLKSDIFKTLFNSIELLLQQSSLVKQGGFSLPRFLLFLTRIRH